jgi:glucose/mannose-6-phosphate isomerase
MVVIAGGGQLAQLAESWHAPLVRLPAGIPKPRAGVGAVALPPLVILERIGLFPGASGWIREAVDQLRVRRDRLVAPANPALEIARRIGRTMPVIYGGGELGAVAAMRWKNQVNENAKCPAFFGVVPELTHNEVCGWGQHGDVTRQVFTLVTLRHDHEHPQVMRRFDLLRDVLTEVVQGIEEVHAEGEGALAQLFDLMLFGDFVSLHLAYEAGVDPGPIPVIDDLKDALKT